MKVILRAILLLVIAVAAVSLVRGCSDTEKTGPAVPPADKVWTAAEVAADPTAYMNWADAKIARQIEDRRKRIQMLTDKLASIESRQKTMQDNLKDTVNLQNRMEAAIRRAEDEDRWPVQVAGRSFDKAEAQAVLEQTRKYIEDRKPLSGSYDQAVARARSMSAVLNREIDELNRLREKMALDLEGVRLSQGLEDLEKLRKTEADISGYAKAVGAMADDSMVDAFSDPTKDTAKVTIDSFMKK